MPVWDERRWDERRCDCCGEGGGANRIGGEGAVLGEVATGEASCSAEAALASAFWMAIIETVSAPPPMDVRGGGLGFGQNCPAASPRWRPRLAWPRRGKAPRLYPPPLALVKRTTPPMPPPLSVPVLPPMPAPPLMPVPLPMPVPHPSRRMMSTRSSRACASGINVRLLARGMLLLRGMLLRGMLLRGMLLERICSNLGPTSYHETLPSVVACGCKSGRGYAGGTCGA